MRLFGVAFALLLAGSATAMAQPRLIPMDQAVSVPDFFGFRAQLQMAVARRDALAVRAALSKNVLLSLGPEGSGAKAFDAIWTPSAHDSRLWEVLSTLLALGGVFEPDGRFMAPYVFALWPSNKDPLDHVVALSAGTRVHSAPSAGAAVIAILDFSIVERVGALATDGRWEQVRLRGGHTGFVDSRFVRSPVDYRISFAKREGRWEIVSLIAGD